MLKLTATVHISNNRYSNNNKRYSLGVGAIAILKIKRLNKRNKNLFDT